VAVNNATNKNYVEIVNYVLYYNYNKELAYFMIKIVEII